MDKEYTTLEMITASKDNKNDIFQCNTIGKEKVSWRYERGQYRLIWVTADYPNFQITEDTLKLKWTKVRQPISFNEAAKAHKENKKIMCEGQAFEEWNYNVHVCPSFPIPKHWRRWRSNINWTALIFWTGYFVVIVSLLIWLTVKVFWR